MAVRRSVSFTTEALEAVKQWRLDHAANEMDIPDFSRAVNELILQGARNSVKVAACVNEHLASPSEQE